MSNDLDVYLLDVFFQIHISFQLILFWLGDTLALILLLALFSNCRDTLSVSLSIFKCVDLKNCPFFKSYFYYSWPQNSTVDIMWHHSNSLPHQLLNTLCPKKKKKLNSTSCFYFLGFNFYLVPCTINKLKLISINKFKNFKSIIVYVFKPLQLQLVIIDNTDVDSNNSKNILSKKYNCFYKIPNICVENKIWIGRGIIYTRVCWSTNGIRTHFTKVKFKISLMWRKELKLCSMCGWGTKVRYCQEQYQEVEFCFVWQCLFGGLTT